MTEYEQQKKVFLEKEVKKLYTNRRYRGEVKKFCKVHQLSHHKLTKIGCSIGVIQPRRRGKLWSKEELDILKQHKDKSDEAIRYRLRNAGYDRGLSAINSKVARTKIFKIKNHYSANVLAGIMRVSIAVILGWIHKGLLQVKQPYKEARSNEYMIKPEQVREFIITNISIIDIAVIDKFWLIDILTNKEAE